MGHECAMDRSGAIMNIIVYTLNHIPHTQSTHQCAIDSWRRRFIEFLPFRGGLIRQK